MSNHQAPPSLTQKSTKSTKLGLGIQKEAGQRLIEFCQDNALVIANTLNTESRLITFFAVEDREAPYSQQKQDRELTMAQIMNSLLKIQTYIEESRENH